MKCVGYNSERFNVYCDRLLYVERKSSCIYICSVMYLSNFVAYDGSGFLVQRRYIIRVVTCETNLT
jgi:hypothetical protein